MSVPMIDVAVASGDAGARDTLVEALVRAAAQEETRKPNSFQWRFLPQANEESVLAQASGNGALQAVVIDSCGRGNSAPLLARLQALRPELDLFVLLEGEADFPDTPVELLDRRDYKPSQLFRQLRSAINRRARTPFADTLREYVDSASDAWHTPGHSSGDSLRDSPWVSDFYEMMGEHVFNTDLSVSVQSLDSLLDPHSVIQEAQTLAAEAFGARRSFFVTNGTSTANKVVVQHLLGGGGKIILDQACHKSVHHAVILSGAQPVYLAASVNTRFGFYGPVPRQRLFEAIDAHPDAKLLVLTSCTYDGFRYDLKPIIERAHRHGIKVLIDEAWYAHGRFHPTLRPTALECGADYVTQSIHKMLSAFSQASMIHVADPDFEEHRFREHLNMHTSTSPQYPMIASLDVARKQMSMEGFSRLSRCIDIAARLREGINRSGVFRVLELGDILPGELAEDGIDLDPLKLSVDVSASGMSARQVQLQLFEEFGIQVEKVTHNTLTVLVTLGATESKVLRLVNALNKLGRAGGPAAGCRSVTPLPALSAFRMLPREAYFGDSESLPLAGPGGALNPRLPGAVSADQVVPYPPGIPVLNPGQLITADIAHYLLELYRSGNGIEIHGLAEQGGEPRLRVVKGRRVQAAAANA